MKAGHSAPWHKSQHALPCSEVDNFAMVLLCVVVLYPAVYVAVLAVQAHPLLLKANVVCTSTCRFCAMQNGVPRHRSELVAPNG